MDDNAREATRDIAREGSGERKRVGKSGVDSSDSSDQHRPLLGVREYSPHACTVI